jgi:hypothetical protein
VGRPSIAPEKLLRAQTAADAVLDPQRAFAEGRDGFQPRRVQKKKDEPIVSSSERLLKNYS